jgi:hypothetical protein
MSNINLLPTISSTASTYFVVTQNSVAYRFAWRDLANSVQGIGPQGTAGRNGTNGVQGPTGFGAQGFTGAQGSGPQGTQGIGGAQGAGGTQGTAGANPAFNVIPAPLSSTSSGFVGQIAADSTYIYVCVAANNWRRIYAPVSSGF